MGDLVGEGVSFVDKHPTVSNLLPHRSVAHIVMRRSPGSSSVLGLPVSRNQLHLAIDRGF
jgi:hypothetical protein